MPIECEVETKLIGQEQFHAADKLVMRHAFDIHNELGRFCDERIYKDELARRCRVDGYEVHQEVPLKASIRDFTKLYYLDMLLGRSIVYELKTVEALNTSHENQLINYLLLTGLNHGKLINFRPGSVVSRFVSTHLERADRSSYQLSDSDWQGDDEPSCHLRAMLCAILDDWGVFLDVNLYREALLYFMKGPDAGIQDVTIALAGRVVGTQQMFTLNAGTAWHLSAIRINQKAYESHLARLLRHLTLDRIQWINLDHRSVQLKTLAK